MRIVKIIITSLMLLNLASCATYKSSFNCGDSKGVYCASMDRVDQMINSEIHKSKTGSTYRKSIQWIKT